MHTPMDKSPNRKSIDPLSMQDRGHRVSERRLGRDPGCRGQSEVSDCRGFWRVF